MNGNLLTVPSLSQINVQNNHYPSLLLLLQLYFMFILLSTYFFSCMYLSPSKTQTLMSMFNQVKHNETNVGLYVVQHSVHEVMGDCMHAVWLQIQSNVSYFS